MSETPAPELSVDADTLDPVPTEIKLSNGAVVEFEEFKTRQFFRLLRIVTRGAGHMLGHYRLDASMPPEQFMTNLMVLVMFAIPEAEDETIAFMRSMIHPTGLIERKSLSKLDEERNTALWAQLDEALVNPDLEDSLEIISMVVRREAENIQKLGKKIRTMLEMAQKTGQLKTPSSAASPESST